MKLKDLGYSLVRDIGSDATEGVFDHLTVLGKISLKEFVRRGRGIPHGFFEEAKLRFSNRMIDIHQGKGKPIVIVPIGTIPSDIIEMVARVGWEVFGLPVRVLRPRPMWPQVYDPKDQAADADKILRVLRPFEKVGRVIAITDTILRAPKTDGTKERVYGYGGVLFATSVVTTYSFEFDSSEKEHLPWGRLIRVAIHELAHGFGISHHEKDGIECVMNLLPGNETQMGLDIMTHELCTDCLGKVMSNHVLSSKKEIAPCK